jgi:hypothetical protein
MEKGNPFLYYLSFIIKKKNLYLYNIKIYYLFYMKSSCSLIIYNLIKSITHKKYYFLIEDYSKAESKILIQFPDLDFEVF